MYLTLNSFWCLTFSLYVPRKQKCFRKPSDKALQTIYNVNVSTLYVLFIESTEPTHTQDQTELQRKPCSSMHFTTACGSCSTKKKVFLEMNDMKRV